MAADCSRAARSRARLAVALTILMFATTGCTSSDATDEPPTAETAPTEVADPSTVREALVAGSQVVDVRTPEEFAAGHLRRAINIDVSAPDFEDRIADLDESATYVVYCASGNRAGTAIEQMRDQGFDILINGGGYEDLADLGLPTT